MSTVVTTKWANKRSWRISVMKFWFLSTGRDFYSSMYSYLGRIRGQRGQATYLPLTAPFGSHRVLNLKPTPVRESNFALHYCKRLAWSVSESLALPRVFCRSEAEVRSSSSRFSWGVVEQDLEGARVSDPPFSLPVFAASQPPHFLHARPCVLAPYCPFLVSQQRQLLLRLTPKLMKELPLIVA